MEQLQEYIAYWNQMDKTTFILSILLVIAGTSILKKGFQKLSKVVIGIGVYAFARGIITTGMILSWWEQVPQFVQTVFFV
jgi:hypothetical protein